MKRILNTVALSAVCMLALASPTPHKKVDSDIVDTAVASKQFPTLVKLLQAADLVDTLKGAGPFTVFAPSEAAFAKIPKAEVAKLLSDKEALKRILLYHVVPGKVLAADVVTMNGKTAKTANDLELHIKVSKKGKVHVNSSKVIKTDILCSNGVIHVIDTVLMPPAAN